MLRSLFGKCRYFTTVGHELTFKVFLRTIKMWLSGTVCFTNATEEK